MRRARRTTPTAGTALGLCLVAALLLAGCAAQGTRGGGSATSDGGQPLAWSDLAGRTFTSTAVTRSGAPAGLVAGATLELSFTADGIAASAGCNRMFGGAHLDAAARLVLAGPLASTMMACSDGLEEQERWYSGFLSSQPLLAASGATLTLTGGGMSAGESVAMSEVAAPEVTSPR